MTNKSTTGEFPAPVIAEMVMNSTSSSSSSQEDTQQQSKKRRYVLNRLNVINEHIDEQSILCFTCKQDTISKLSTCGGCIDDDNDNCLKHINSDLVYLSSPPFPYFSLYPLTFVPTLSISKYVKHHKSSSDADSATEVSLSGMIMNKKSFSKSTFIYELRCLERYSQAHIIVIAEARNSDMDDTEFSRFHCSLKQGFLLGVSGCPGKSENGEIAIFPTSCIVLTGHPKLKFPRNPDYVAADTFQQCVSLERYKQIRKDKEVFPIFMLRFEIVNSITSLLHRHNFFKSANTGVFPGTAVSPIDPGLLSYIRPSLIVWQHKMSCGDEYAYELGKKIKNGELDLTHTPKLTTFELYMDVDYNSLMEVTERILSDLVKDRTGGYKIKCHANRFNMDPLEIDFKPPFSKINIMEELDRLENLEKPAHFSGDAMNRYLVGACTKYGINCPSPQTTGQLLDELVKHFLEKYVNPTFILYDSKIMSLPEKCRRFGLGLTQGFELFINKQQVFNGYTTLEDRFSSIKRIWKIKDRELTEDEAVALEHGLILTGGWSIGMDHLTMLLGNAESIAEEESPLKVGAISSVFSSSDREVEDSNSRKQQQDSAQEAKAQACLRSGRGEEIESINNRRIYSWVQHFN